MVSLTGVGIIFTAAAMLSIKITWDFLLVVYLGTESVYLYNRFKEYKVDFLTNPERTAHIKKYVKYIPFIIFSMSFSAIAIVIFFNKISALILGLLLLILGLFYSVFLKNITQKIIGFKGFFVSLCFTSLVLCLIVYYASPLTYSFFVVVIFVFLREIINPNFCDIKDVESDKKERLLTLAVVMGKEKLIYLLGLINIFSAVPLLLGIYLDLIPKFAIMLLLTIPYSFYYLKKSKEEKINYNLLYNILPDGEYFLWLIFISLGKLLI